jgi:hypothetical protein
MRSIKVRYYPKMNRLKKRDVSVLIDDTILDLAEKVKNLYTKNMTNEQKLSLDITNDDAEKAWNFKIKNMSNEKKWNLMDQDEFYKDCEKIKLDSFQARLVLTEIQSIIYPESIRHTYISIRD